MKNKSNPMERLSPFVGIWDTSGRIKSSDGSDDKILTATDTYEWLPGKHFLAHKAEAMLGKERSRSLEIFGWDDIASEYFSTAYDDKGVRTNFRCTFINYKWRIEGEGIRFRGIFKKDWIRLSGVWETYSDETWSEWMNIVLTKKI